MAPARAPGGLFLKTFSKLEVVVLAPKDLCLLSEEAILLLKFNVFRLDKFIIGLYVSVLPLNTFVLLVLALICLGELPIVTPQYAQFGSIFLESQDIFLKPQVLFLFGV